VHDAPQTQLAVEAFGGYLDVLDGRAGGVARIGRALDEARAATPAPGASAIVGHVLLSACAAARESRTGLAAADELLAEESGVRLWEAETRRLRAEFLDRLGAPPAEVDAELVRAVEVAGRQGARTLELRAATSLLRFRMGRGDASRAGETGEHLAALVAALPEARAGRDTRDAAALLARG
jgi:adenylate cyclase